MLNTKEFKEIYKRDLETVWGNRGKSNMVDYCLKEFSNATVFDNGDYVIFEKPRIETSFCFGYGYCGISTDDDYKDASNMANVARTKESYFIEENLKGLRDKKAMFLDDRYDVYVGARYCTETDDCNLKDYRTVRWHEEPRFGRDCRKLTADERKMLADTIDEEIEKFTKRLNTYLKRYGLSKVRSWTYLVD